jgi:dihydroorotase
MTKQTWIFPEHKNIGQKVAYINARLIDPASGLDKKGELLTIGDKIADFGPKIFKNTIPDNAEVVDCQGHILCPGLLDIQVHLREPGQEFKETIATASKSSAAGGVTTMVGMPNTKPVIDSASMVGFISKKARESSYVNVRTYGAITQGQQGKDITEMGLMKEAGAVGFTDDGLPVMNSLVMRRAMEYCSMLDLPIAQHAEDLNLSNGGCINEGPVSAKLGLNGVPNASEAIIVERDLLLLEITGGHYHILHISTHQAIDAVRRAKAKGLNVTCEAAPHHFTLTDEATAGYRTFAKMNPPLRTDKDIKAIIAGIKDGTIDAIATDHAPHDQENKRVPLAQAAFGIVGLETMLPLSLSLYHNNKIPLKTILGAMTYRPADIIRQPMGRLKKNAIADLTIIDLNREWIVCPEDFVSRSKNCPFDEYKVKGRAIRTIVSGQTIYTLDD